MARVLVIEDDRDIQDVLDYNLRQAGHEVLCVCSGADGLRVARARHHEIVLLDLMLPDILGVEVLKALKEDTRLRGIPVMILTARGEEIDRVVGFEVGADDYVVKPFSVRELVLRVQAILRRANARANPQGDQRSVFGRLVIDVSAHRVWVDDTEAPLTAMEFRLLLTLFERRDRVQTRDTLLDDVWGISAQVETRTVDTHVQRLRDKLGRARDYIETVRGVGYRFLATPPPGEPAP